MVRCRPRALLGASDAFLWGPYLLRLALHGGLPATTAATLAGGALVTIGAGLVRAASACDHGIAPRRSLAAGIAGFFEPVR